MQIKDYYAILEIEPSATLPEIKKAYRRLALQFHPDKKQDDPYAAAQFNEIKEAYEVLTNPAKKEYYLQQRWYDQSIGKRKKQDIITPVSVLKQHHARQQPAHQHFDEKLLLPLSSAAGRAGLPAAASSVVRCRVTLR